MTSILEEKGVDREGASLQGVDSHVLRKRTNNGESSGNKSGKELHSEGIHKGKVGYKKEQVK